MVYMLLGTGFEETEAIAPLDLLRRAGVKIATVGINGKVIYGGHGIGIEADLELHQMDLTTLEMVILPGGQIQLMQLQIGFNSNTVTAIYHFSVNAHGGDFHTGPAQQIQGGDGLGFLEAGTQ